MPIEATISMAKNKTDASDDDGAQYPTSPENKDPKR